MMLFSVTEPPYHSIARTPVRRRGAPGTHRVIPQAKAVLRAGKATVIMATAQ